jgi:hypothetical protein
MLVYWKKSVCRLHTVKDFEMNEGEVERTDWCRRPKCSDAI